MLPKYSEVRISEKRVRREPKATTLRDDNSGSRERFFNISNFEVAILREVCGVAVMHSTCLFGHTGAVLTSRVWSSYHGVQLSQVLERAAEKYKSADLYMALWAQ